mmetsp:Transcript_5208/g.13146  ORF Transcript_5208/g.13146 Transcript_5208/m.13146 type:complete len:265 (-) Transcript_5208:515-1309(-)
MSPATACRCSCTSGVTSAHTLYSDGCADSTSPHCSSPSTVRTTSSAPITLDHSRLSTDMGTGVLAGTVASISSGTRSGSGTADSNIERSPSSSTRSSSSSSDSICTVLRAVASRQSCCGASPSWSASLPASCAVMRASAMDLRARWNSAAASLGASPVPSPSVGNVTDIRDDLLIRRLRSSPPAACAACASAFCIVGSELKEARRVSMDWRARRNSCAAWEAAPPLSAICGGSSSVMDIRFLRRLSTACAAASSSTASPPVSHI